jgi:hypothetical protein
MELDELLRLKKELRMKIFLLTNDADTVAQYLDELAGIEKQLSNYGY